MIHAWRIAGLAALGLVLCSPAPAQSSLQFTVRPLDWDRRAVDGPAPAGGRGGSALEGAGASLAVGRGVAMTETADEIRLTLSADVLFDFDKWAIRRDARAALAQAASVLRGHPGRPVTVEGHTDSKGSDAYNQRLSERRAASVRAWLTDVEGLRGHSWIVRGQGEARPVAPNETPDGRDDPEGRQRNRRVELVIAK